MNRIPLSCSEDLPGRMPVETSKAQEKAEKDHPQLRIEVTPKEAFVVGLQRPPPPAPVLASSPARPQPSHPLHLPALPFLVKLQLRVPEGSEGVSGIPKGDQICSTRRRLRPSEVWGSPETSLFPLEGPSWPRFQSRPFQSTQKQLLRTLGL